MTRFTKPVLALGLAGALALAVATPSEARNGRNAAAIGAGIAGLAVGTAIGAAVASNRYYYGEPYGYYRGGYAYEPAYTAYLAFKRVVRDDMGSSSVHYRRLHIRPAPSPVARDEQAEQATPDSAVVPSVRGSSVATGEPKPVKVA